MVGQDQFGPHVSEIHTHSFLSGVQFIIYLELHDDLIDIQTEKQKIAGCITFIYTHSSLFCCTYGGEITKAEDRAAARQSRRGEPSLMSDLKQNNIFVN